MHEIKLFSGSIDSVEREVNEFLNQHNDRGQRAYEFVSAEHQHSADPGNGSWFVTLLLVVKVNQ